MSSWPEPSGTGPQSTASPLWRSWRSQQDSIAHTELDVETYFSEAGSAGENAEGYIFPLQKLRGDIKHPLDQQQTPRSNSRSKDVTSNGAERPESCTWEEDFCLRLVPGPESEELPVEGAKLHFCLQYLFCCCSCCAALSASFVAGGSQVQNSVYS